MFSTGHLILDTISGNEGKTDSSPLGNHKLSEVLHIGVMLYGKPPIDAGMSVNVAIMQALFR